MKIDNKELPPRLISGKVTPTTGNKPTAIDTFVTTNNIKIAEILPENIFAK
tara:strand:+ start:1642 stop:1794 length:153 start_codon:yes stop_codon:yes gene_type:complete